MKIIGSYTIDAPRDQVWAALNDMEVLARIVPGCERLEQTGENEFEGTIKIGIQTIKGTYNGRIRIEDIQPPHHYRLIAKGRSANGVVDGSGTVDLAEQDGRTILTYAGDALVGGVLASVGQRLIEGASKLLINQSLKALVEQIAARQAGPAIELEVGAETAAGPAGWEVEAESVPMPAEAAPTPPMPGLAEGQEPATPAAQEPPPPSQAPQPPQPSPQRRTVIVPDHEQLKPALVARGVVEDFLQERPWLLWIVVAFLLGLILGRSRR